MKTSEDIQLHKATYRSGYVIRLEFSDGRVLDMDFHPVLSNPKENPMVRQFLDITLFTQFRIADKQDLVWGDHEMGFPFETLYAGDFRVHWDGKKYSGPANLRAGRPVRTNQRVRKAATANVSRRKKGRVVVR